MTEAQVDAGKPLLLLTGGAGVVGRLLIPHLRRSHRLRITDREAGDALVDVLEADDEFIAGDLGDADFSRRMVRGCDAIVHLAANASASSSAAESMMNVDMTAKLLLAAEEFAVRQLVLASSVHATGLDYRDGVVGIDPGHVPRPCCAYGTSKVAVEALARLHQQENGNAVSCLRLGLTGWALIQREFAGTWLSEDDLGRLATAALARAPGFGIYHAVSADAAQRWDTANAAADLEWSPRDRWDVDVDRLPRATTCDCRLFAVVDPA